MERWRKLSERTVYRGYRHVVARTFEVPGGGEAVFEVLVNPPTVAVLALTPEQDVILVREFRPGPEDFLLELPGGLVDAGEIPLDAGVRELLEETGYAGTALHVGSHAASAYTTHEKHAVLATDCYQAGAPDPSEHGEVVVIPLPEFRRHLRTGRLTDVGIAYLTLDSAGLL